MNEYYGVHGTCCSRAEKISDDGFNVGPGHRGTGAYFWRKNSYSEKLAICWFLRCLNAGDYSLEVDKRCATISTKLRCVETEFLDLDDPQNKDHILGLIHQNEVTSEEEMCAVYDRFVETIERQCGHSITLIQSSIRAPNKPVILQRWPGDPTCYIARCSDAIAIDDVVVYEGVTWECIVQSGKLVGEPTRSYVV